MCKVNLTVIKTTISNIATAAGTVRDKEESITFTHAYSTDRRIWLNQQTGRAASPAYGVPPPRW